MSDRRRYGSLLCPDCGHHLHRPNPGICQWYDCKCPAEAAAPAGLDVEELTDIIEQAIFETDTGLAAAILAADRINARLTSASDQEAGE